MSRESGFLISLGQTLATMALYNEGHPARERAFDAAYEQLLALTDRHSCVEYSFLGGETVVNGHALPELAAWDWASRLSEAGIQRIEVDAEASRDALVRFVADVFEQLNGRGRDTAEVQQLVRAPIRFGLLRVQGTDRGQTDAAGAGRRVLTLPGGVTLAEEIEAIEWIHGEVRGGVPIPMVEVEAVVRSLAAAMRTDERIFLPLLTLKRYDQYTTTHALNVAVLAMGLCERLGLGPADVRSFGVSGLLHDLGKVNIPHDLLVKPGRYTEDERAVVQRHPVDGARLIMERERGLGLAAVVAYEHHVFLNGQGYPVFRFPRPCHYASRIVHVCDIYDALCTDRPYRAAWEPAQALDYLQAQAGKEVDPEVVRAFVEMIGEARVSRLDVEAAAAAAPAAAASA